jgi:acyl-CoA synthetase (NDP forming)
MKAVCRGLVHKSDIGAVKLGLNSGDAVAEAYAQISEAVMRAIPNGALDGCLVQEMRPPKAELILGIKRDPQFGPVVVCGAGGVLVELVRDTQMALAPISTAKAHAMLGRLAVWPMLEGYRGAPPLDIAAAANALSALSWLAHDNADRLAELDINPLGVGLAGEGVVALDARAAVTKI